MTAEHVATLVGREMTDELRSAFSRVRHCVDQLSDAQVWRRETPAMIGERRPKSHDFGDPVFNAATPRGARRRASRRARRCARGAAGR